MYEPGQELKRKLIGSPNMVKYRYRYPRSEHSDASFERSGIEQLAARDNVRCAKECGPVASLSADVGIPYCEQPFVSPTTTPFCIALVPYRYNCREVAALGVSLPV